MSSDGGVVPVAVPVMTLPQLSPLALSLLTFSCPDFGNRAGLSWAGYDPAVSRFAPTERDALADLLVELGPDAQTLCTGWTTRDLAAHLVVRGTRADAAAGIAIPALAGHARKVQEKVAAQDWIALVTKARRRPAWAIVGDEAVNQVEYFVHHEDVRRAQPDWEPRELPAEFSTSLWGRVRFQGRLALRKIPAKIEVTAPGFGSFMGGKGGPAAQLVGPPQELMLFLMGRQEHARVDVTGPTEIVNQLRTAKFGV